MANDYGSAHKRARRVWDQRIRNGTKPPCARCGWSILPTDEWHLDHTDDGLAYLGPSHEHCNLSAAGKKVQKLRARTPQRHTNQASRNW